MTAPRPTREELKEATRAEAHVEKKGNLRHIEELQAMLDGLNIPTEVRELIKRVLELEAELDQLNRDQKRQKWLSEADNKEIDALTSERDSWKLQAQILQNGLAAVKEADPAWTTNVDMWIAKADEIAGKKK